MSGLLVAVVDFFGRQHARIKFDIADFSAESASAAAECSDMEDTVPDRQIKFERHTVEGIFFTVDIEVTLVPVPGESQMIPLVMLSSRSLHGG